MRTIWLIAGLFFMILVQGCYYKEPHPAQTTIADVEAVRPDSPPLTLEKADL